MPRGVPYLAVCVGGLALGLLASMSGVVAGPQAPARRTQAPSITRQRQVPDPIPPHIAELLRAGRLMEAQDAYLEILITLPQDLSAMHGLVALRKRLSLGDPDLLRRQADAYGQAAKTGVEISGEHYTRMAMSVLAEASLRAAQEIEQHRGEKADQTSFP